MRKISFSADEELIRQAKLVARTQGKSLNTAFREWLAEFIGLSGSAKKAEGLMRRLGHVKAGRRFTRDEMIYAKFAPLEELHWQTRLPNPAFPG